MTDTIDHGQGPASGGDSGLSMAAAIRPLAANAGWLALALVAGAAAGLGTSFLIAPTYTAENTFLLPQPAESGVTVSNSGTLNALANAAGGGRNTAEQYISMMESVTVRDRIIQRFDFRKVYDKPTMVQTRVKLARNTRLSANRKDALIHVEFDDTDPQRAAAVANAYVEELRWVTSHLAVTEAQKRRMFFEAQLKATKDVLTNAQIALESSGFTGGALKAQPAAAAEAYARLRAELTVEEVKLQTLRARLADTSPEVRTEQATIDALRSQLGTIEQSDSAGKTPSADYTTRLREFKYDEILLELYSRQYELARADEARDGVLIQVLDTATPPERESAPRRPVYAALGAVVGFAALASWLLFRRRRTALA
jgi:uncharacterized protein involved in exopolysaccharide biosynthesis